MNRDNLPESELLSITVTFDEGKIEGAFKLHSATTSATWDRMRQFAGRLSEEVVFSPLQITLPWPSVLSVIREFAPLQKKWRFRFLPDAEARERIDEFLAEYRSVRAARQSQTVRLSFPEIEERLRSVGFRRRSLKNFQLRDLQHLLSMRNGANFSVPGAGKTTVTFALHLLTQTEGQRLLVICPKSAFPAWSEVVEECIGADAPAFVREPFTALTGGSDAIRHMLKSDRSRFVITYDQLITAAEPIIAFLLQNPVHVVLDESHRMKGGLAVRRGAVLLNLATLPVRRDILSGTPMPQAPTDLQSQLDFLWPGMGLGNQILRGASPREVIGNLYVRTTKADLGLPPVERRFIHVGMGRGQAALYGIVRSELIRQCSSMRSDRGVDLIRARRSVMRLLQLSSNPVLALRGIMDDSPDLESGIMKEVVENGPSPKLIAVRDLARHLAAEGRKTVIWTIFTDTIEQLDRMLADLNPVTVYGAIPSGDVDDLDTREGRLRKFRTDPTCMTFIANPAAAGEGISLHQVCHDAIYVDRSYNSTHYLQSIDRIHRLGLPSDVRTSIHIFQTTAPRGMGCIDHSVSRRLAIKIRALQQLLDDEDLHEIAFDEESADEPIDYDIDPEDLMDLVAELEGTASYDADVGA